MDQALLDELEREGTITIDGVIVETTAPETAGWAVFSGCEGEDARLVAMFFGRGAQQGNGQG